MKKDDERGDVYENLDKSSALQEARVFNETPIKPSKCSLTLAKVLYLLHQGEHFQPQEATNLFFSVTKLFQSKDTQLRKMVYLMIKELAPIVPDVMMATSSLTKDINDKMAAEIGYRANAIRALCTITDPTMVQSVERFFKQAIVDKDTSVACSAIVSSVHLFNRTSKDMVRRWSNEVQEALNRPAGMIQYHALGLMFQIKQHDKMAVTKIIQTMAKGNQLRSHFAYCMLIRFTYKVMEDDGGLEGPNRGLYEILENCLRHRHEMVNLEAARAICNLKGVTSKELFPTVAVLQLFLNSPKATLRFSSVRTLSQLAVAHPAAVAACNLDLENLINDSNRNISTFAITTLLKTGNEASVDRLMKQITGFMSDISDEFKVIIADAIRALCLKFPSKHTGMLQFLSNALREEGGYEFKRAVVDGIFDIIASIPESKDAALSYLCEFIEDCEYTRIAVRILRLLGEEGPTMPNPTKYIKYIYNRTIIENSPVRAAAVSALGKFAVKLGGEVKSNVRILLNRCLDDVDDEVRDRAVMNLKLLEEEYAPEIAQRYIGNESSLSFLTLEKQLANYLADTTAHRTPFDFRAVPVITRAQESAQRQQLRAATSELNKVTAMVSNKTPSAPASPNSKATAKTDIYATQAAAATVESIPQFSSYGPVFRSSKRVELTETDVAEYVVSCVKHTFAEYIVFQFDCKNTLDDVMLENLTVNMEANEDIGSELVPFVSMPISALKYDQPESTFVSFKKVHGRESFPLGSFSCSLKFVSKDCDPQTGEPDEEGYDDVYQLEAIEVNIGDYAVPSYTPNFKGLWSELNPQSEIVETFQLSSINNIQDAIKEILDILGMAPCENSDSLPKDKSASTITSHMLLLSGIFVGGARCAVRVRMACVSGTPGVTMELAVRSDQPVISQLVAESIG